MTPTRVELAAGALMIAGFAVCAWALWPPKKKKRSNPKRKIENPEDTPERAKYLRAVKAAKRAIAKLAAGETDWQPARRALDRMFALERWVSAEDRLLGDEVAATYSAAQDAGAAARSAARDAEIAQLRQAERASEPRPGTWEHELALMRKKNPTHGDHKFREPLRLRIQSIGTSGGPKRFVIQGHTTRGWWDMTSAFPSYAAAQRVAEEMRDRFVVRDGYLIEKNPRKKSAAAIKRELAAFARRERRRRLRGALQDARAELATTDAACRTERERKKSQAAKLRAQRRELAQTCKVARAEGRERVRQARGELATWRAGERERIEAEKRARGPALRRTAAEARAESDDEVRQNIPRELVPVWNEVRRHIHAKPRQSRTEAFLEWVEAHPDEVLHREAEAAEADVERMIADYYASAEGF